MHTLKFSNGWELTIIRTRGIFGIRYVAIASIGNSFHYDMQGLDRRDIKQTAKCLQKFGLAGVI